MKSWPEGFPAKSTRGKKIGQGCQGIDAEEQADRIRQLIDATIFCLQKKPEKNRQTKALADLARVCPEGVFQTMRTCLRSMIPKPLCAAATIVDTSSALRPKRVVA